MSLLKRLLFPAVLPCYVFSRKPWIIFAFELDFIRNVEPIAAYLPKDEPVHIFLQLGWQHELREDAERLAGELHSIEKNYPNFVITVLANAPGSVTQLTQSGVTTILSNHNVFLDPQCVPIVKMAKRYDAIYLARVTPFKRHALAKNVKSLLLIGGHSPKEEDYFNSVMPLFADRMYIPKVSARAVPKYIASARCMLALSEAEGAMFASGEGLLCGVPIVNTPSLGGREELFPDFAYRNVDATPEAVADGVEYWKAHPVDPRDIRAAFIEKCRPHYDALHKILCDLTGREIGHLPHKLGVRRTLFPHERIFHGLLKK